MTGVMILFKSHDIKAQNKPIRVGIAGLTHTHVHWIFGSEPRGEIEIVGIAEANRELAARYAAQHGFSMDIVYPSLKEMIDATTPEAVTAFGSIYEHLEVVQICAPRGIHVMVEKPLAVSMAHATEMKRLAEQHNIHLLTNYETTWYPSHREALTWLQSDTIGDLRKVVIRDGHKGPKKIGINDEFLEWLTDPIQNGGGAIVDFGCYGANLMTWLMDGERPISVTAITQQLQAENNPQVDDESIIILQYPTCNAVIQGSWNWPIGRKDMDMYGETGAIHVDNRNDIRLRIAEGYDGFHETKRTLDERSAPYDDPFAFFAAVIQGDIIVPPYDLNGLDNNMLVVEILDAARKSAKTNQTIFFIK